MIKLIHGHLNISTPKKGESLYMSNVSQTLFLTEPIFVKNNNSIHDLYTVLKSTIYSLRVGTQYEMNENSYKSLNFTGVKTAMEIPKFGEHKFKFQTANSSLSSPTMNFNLEYACYFFYNILNEQN